MRNVKPRPFSLFSGKNLARVMSQLFMVVGMYM